MASTRSYSGHHGDSHADERTRPLWKKSAFIWSVQITLALAVLFAGAGKLFASGDPLDDSPFAPVFLRAIGFCEMLAALGLILPGALKMLRGLTPLAAMGLVLIMSGATVTEISQEHWSTMATPFVLGLMAAFVAWQRWPWLQEPGGSADDGDSRRRGVGGFEH